MQPQIIIQEDSAFLTDTAHRIGGELSGNVLSLPPSVGTGTIRAVTDDPKLTLIIQHYTLREAITIRRIAADRTAQAIIITFQIRQSITATIHLHRSSVRLYTPDVDFERILPADQPVFTVTITVQKDYLASLLQQSGHSFFNRFVSLGRPVVYESIMTKEIQLVLRQLVEREERTALDSFYFHIKAQELIYSLFIELLKREEAPALPLNRADVERLFRIRDSLLKDLSVVPKLPQLAKEVGMSESKMKRLFRQIFGNSVFAYYQTARLEEASVLLQQYPVAEAGYRLGFTNISHFARVFARHYGVLPKKYQQQTSPSVE